MAQKVVVKATDFLELPACVLSPEKLLAVT